VRARQCQSRADSHSSSISSASRRRASSTAVSATSARVERGVVRGQFGELQRPEEGAECLAAPDGVDDYRVAVRLGHALERGLELRAQGAAAFDDLSLGAKPAARHRFASLA